LSIDCRLVDRRKIPSNERDTTTFKGVYMEGKRITTEEFASKVGVKPGTIRRGFCLNGHYLGLKPVKLPNRRLLWSAAKADKLLDEPEAAA